LSRELDTDIVIIGAGFTGLSAARALGEAGVDFLLLEARDTVGGRVRSQTNALGERVDTGGQFLCDDMPNVMALARSFGKTLVESHVEGELLVQPPASAKIGERIYAGSMAIRERMNRIDPSEASIAGMSVEAWLEAQPDAAECKTAFRAMIEGLWCLSLERLPMWHLIDNDRRITNEVSELQYFLAETMHSLAEDLAQGFGARLRLRTIVSAIHYGSEGVRVLAGDITVTARVAIVALPPRTASKLAYAPALPPVTAQALSVWESGAVIKALVRYRRPLWRERGLSGMVMWREPTSLFAFDSSPDADHATLAFFIGGPLALSMRKLGEAAVREEILARLAAALGAEAGEPLDLMLLDWIDDPWSGGAYSDLVVDMGATDAEAVLRTGVPRIVFACSELSPSFPGYIEGAIVTGREAAKKARDEARGAR